MRKLLALAIAAVSAPAIVFAASSQGQLLGPPAAPGQTGLFNTPCRYSHRAADDPIVFPGKAGASHMHDFLGNVSTGADSSLESLGAAPALCKRGTDRSAYWVPTLYENGNALAPESANIYYRTAGRDPATIEPFPQGLRVIAGDARAGAPQDTDVVKWECTTDANLRPGDPVPGFYRRRMQREETMSRLRRSTRAHKRGLRRARRAGALRAVKRHKRALARLRARRAELRADPVFYGGLPVCPEGQVVHLSLRFPDCWDGTRLDSPDHKSHLAESIRLNGAKLMSCPASHPRAVPNITINLRYPTRGGPGVRLASGREYTAHADFFNAWDAAGLTELVRRCLNADIHCGAD